jgi:hypothetical protein
VPPSSRLALRVVAVLFVLGASSGKADDKPAKALIEFGWDEPDAAFLRRHIAEMERTPFDGCVFHAAFAGRDGKPGNFAWSCWGKRAFADEELTAAFADLKATPRGRFTRNFLRFNTTPADLDWFDDHGAVVANARLAARLAREGPCAGILLDTEPYERPLFNYRKQRDAASKSWADYAAQARRRGREVMAAFQQGFPGLTVLLTFGHSLPRVQSRDGKTPLADCDDGLLAPFLDGMIDAAEGEARIVDGFELSYGYKSRARFADGRRLMKEGVLPIVADPKKYERFASAGFGLWMDYDWRKRGWDAGDPSRNYFTPEAFESSLRAALEHSDGYVWIYTETPRWWSPEGKSVKLPEAYDAAIRRARKGSGAE